MSRLHRLLNRRENVGISAASTDIAAHELADVVRSLRPTFFDQANGGANLSRGAISALEGIVIHERLLKGVKQPSSTKAFYGRDSRAVLHDRQRQTRNDALPVDQNGARAALTMVTAHFRAGEMESFAKGVEQGRPRRHSQGGEVTIEIQGY